MAELCDLKIHVNGQLTFFLHQKIISRFSGKLRKMMKNSDSDSDCVGIEMDDFPGDPYGFELVSRFCYNGGTTKITVSNVSLLHCCALFLEMTEEVSTFNLLHQTQTFLEGMYYWSWSDILTSLKSCESFFSYADSEPSNSGGGAVLVQNLMTSLISKISHNSKLNEFNPICKNKLGWWFEDLTKLAPIIIERFIKTLGAYGSDNNSLVLTRFLLHYLKTAAAQSQFQSQSLVTNSSSRSEPLGVGELTDALMKNHKVADSNPHSRGQNKKSDYEGLADTAVYGVIGLMGLWRKSSSALSFSCRRLFMVMRVVSGFGVSRDCRGGLERLIAGVLDEATLDDLLVCGGGGTGTVYDVNLVVRLIRLFVFHYYHYNNEEVVSLEKMKKVGRLIDKYLVEIGPDHNLNISKFIRVAQSLADCARDCFDGVYAAVDIYLQCHPSVTMEERSRLCGECLNYEKLSLEACKDLAKNPRIPPRIAVEALIAYSKEFFVTDQRDGESRNTISNQMVLYNAECFPQDKDDNDNEMNLNLQRMQWRMVELEKVCKEMKVQMSSMVKSSTS